MYYYVRIWTNHNKIKGNRNSPLGNMKVKWWKKHVKGEWQILATLPLMKAPCDLPAQCVIFKFIFHFSQSPISRSFCSLLTEKEWAKLAALVCTEKSGKLWHKIQINNKYGYSAVYYWNIGFGVVKYKLSNGHTVQPPQPLGDGGGRLVWRSAAGIGCGNIYLNDFPPSFYSPFGQTWDMIV